MTNNITMPRAAVEQALSTLEGWGNYDKWVWHESALSTAKKNTAEMVQVLRAALDQPQGVQEPVAWLHPDWPAKKYKGVQSPVTTYMVNDWILLYTHPQPRRESLTDEQISPL